MSENTTPDTMEQLYNRLDEYDKQQLFNYGYLLEYTRKLEKEVSKLDNLRWKTREFIINNLLDGDIEWHRKNYQCITGSDLPNEPILRIVDLLEGKDDTRN